MSSKRTADIALKSPLKLRRSDRLNLQKGCTASLYFHEKECLSGQISVKNEPAEAKAVKRESVAKAVKIEKRSKIEIEKTEVEPFTPEPLVKKELLSELRPDLIPPTPSSEPPVLTPRNGNTFYDQIGSNVFTPVSPDHVTASQPKNWQLVYNQIVKMRALIFTPVDSFGCERLPDTITPGISSTDAKTYRFQLLISLMLSSQTKDETNFAAMKTLQEHYTSKGYGGLCLDAILDSSEAEIDKCIARVGFHRRKAVYIKKSCEILRDTFGGEIPKTIEEIVTLPGVGPKMGHLILQNGWSINSGIGVDVHLHRLAQMWGWVPKSEKPELTRATLEDWLPKQYWADINPLLVGFGQTVCAPKANNCDVCFLANGLCKGVNRKLANSVPSGARLVRLAKQRGDLSRLVEARLADAGI